MVQLERATSLSHKELDTELAGRVSTTTRKFLAMSEKSEIPSVIVGATNQCDLNPLQSAPPMLGGSSSAADRAPTSLPGNQLCDSDHQVR